MQLQLIAIRVIGLIAVWLADDEGNQVAYCHDEQEIVSEAICRYKILIVWDTQERK